MNQIIPYRNRLKPGTRHSVSINDNLTGEADAITWWEVLIMLCLLLISGNPYFLVQKFELFTVVFSIIPMVHFVRNYKKSVSYRTIFIFVFFLGYEIMHAFMFKLDYTLTVFKLALILLLSASVVDILKNKFIVVLTKTMVLISLVSFVFVLISYTPLHKPLYLLAERLFPIEKNYEGQSTPTLLIYTFCREYFFGDFSYVRNAGIFWEAGAFAVFLNITLFLHYSSKSIKVVGDLFDKQASILILALATTTSTMGALSLMILLTFFSGQLKSVFKYVLLALIVITSYLAFSTVEFLGEKINRELNQSRITNNRFGSALKDFDNIAERPLLGWSRRIEVVFKTTVRSSVTHRPNGFTNFLRNYGLIYFSVYFFLVFSSFKNIYYYYHHTYNNYLPLFGVILLFIASFSEVIFDLAFLKSLLFLYAAYYPLRANAEQNSFNKPVYA